MSATVPYSLKATGTTATTSVASFTAPSLGDTLLAMITVPTANAPATAIVDSAGYNYLTSPDLVVTGMNGYTYYFVRRSNISGSAPSSISVTGTTGSFSSTVEVARVTGMTATAPVESTFNALLSAGASNTTHTHTYTTTHANAFVWMGSSTASARNLTSSSNGFSVVPTESGGSIHHVAYKADAGAVGTYTTDMVFNAATTYCYAIGVVYKLTDSPTVSSNPDVSTTEGTPATHTVTLSSTTTVAESYPVTLAASGANPATGSGTDFDSVLANMTFGSSGVTYSAGNLLVPSGVLSFPVVIATTSDLLDEADETYTLTVGGVASVGTITDDDAPPTVSISDATESFGTVTHTLTLSQASGKTITVQVDSANGSKTAGTHYTAIVAQTVTFLPGETEQPVVVTVL